MITTIRFTNYSLIMKLIKPYGDRQNDGVVQVSFSLELPVSLAYGVALEVCKNMNLDNIELVDLQPLSDSFTYVIAFGKTKLPVQFDQDSYRRPINKVLSHEEIIELHKKTINKKITIIGACTGTDAHSVGLDSILNIKGFKGDKGLESFDFFNVINLGSQVENKELVEKIKEFKADVVLISQIITQADIHIKNLKDFMTKLVIEKLDKNLLTIAGGPRITNEAAIELGFDAGFGSGTNANVVASYILQHLKS